MKSELACFLDQTRPCNDSCKAFDLKMKDCRLLRTASILSVAIQSIATDVKSKGGPKF